MIDVKALIYVMFCHYIADFILQPRWIAEQKSKDLWVLGTHIGIYFTAMFLACTLIASSWKMAFLYATVNSMLHFVTDLWSSRMTSRAYERKDMVMFWNIIGLDQFLHIAGLIYTTYLLI